jgi:AraC-like DNA-binding protein
MNIYETPLQFGYFLGLLFAVLHWVRGVQEERLSDIMLGWVLFFLAMEIQDYTFGFSGINVLWEELNGFPRYFPWIFPASIYFYLKAQINRDFRFKKEDFWHIMPYLVYFSVHIFYFVQGKAAVEAYNKQPFIWYLEQLHVLVFFVSYVFYFRKSLQLYQNYRVWTETEYSNTAQISFVWLRNFIYLIIAGEVFKLGWNIVDIYLELPYEQDFWWHLFTIGIICYVAIKGYSQPQPTKLRYTAPESVQEAIVKISRETIAESSEKSVFEAEKTTLIDQILVQKIIKTMETDCVFLEPELSLSDLATKLKTNNSVLSATINQHFNKNFNDFVNGYRVLEFKKQVQQPNNQHLTFLAIALDCGFNSKATFNRAYKKATGSAPSTQDI